jgi:hypothetical protein
MTKRRMLHSRLSAMVALAALAAQQAGAEELLPLTTCENFDAVCPESPPEYHERRKRGGNAKGRKWWDQ